MGLEADYLSQYDKLRPSEGQILKQREKKLASLLGHEKLRGAYDSMPDFDASLSYRVNDQGVFIVGEEKKFSSDKLEQISGALECFIPWRSGSWRILGVDIESGWKSDQKWNHIQPVLESELKENSKIGDIGCGNGYFLFRLLEYASDLEKAIGFDPYKNHYYTFHMLQKYVRSEKLFFEPFGFEELELYNQFFDVILCLGVLYHRPDPFHLLERCFHALAPGGKLIISSWGILGKESVALMPRKLYGGKRGFWWLPTSLCMKNMLLRAGFRQAEEFQRERLGTQEQQSTSWCPGAALEFKDSLSKKSTKTKQGHAATERKTLEGYPEPWRFYFKAYK